MRKVSISFDNIVIFDLKVVEDVFEILKSLENEYPSFSEWYHERVCEGLKNKTRSILLAYDDDGRNIVGVSILKNSFEKKICTFRVIPEFQHQGIGTELMRKSIEILGTDLPLITVSENRIDEFSVLFQKFCFKEFCKYPDYYRNGKYEVSYNGYLDKRCLFSIKPQFAFKILSGEKVFEYRKRKTKENISYMVIYAGAPIKKVIGEVQVIDVFSGTPDKIWKLTSEFSGMDYYSYLEYFNGRDNAYAYRLQCPSQYNPYKNLADFNITRPPQSYQYL